MICSVLLKAVLAHLISECDVDVVWDDVVYMYMYVCSGGIITLKGPHSLIS